MYRLGFNQLLQKYPNKKKELFNKPLIIGVMMFASIVPAVAH